VSVLVVTEDKATGSVGARLYYDYFTAGSSRLHFAIVTVLTFGGPALLLQCAWYLAEWGSMTKSEVCIAQL
jgi:hypothetical protein